MHDVLGLQMFLSAATVSTLVVTVFHYASPAMREDCGIITGFVRILIEN